MVAGTLQEGVDSRVVDTLQEEVDNQVVGSRAADSRAVVGSRVVVHYRGRSAGVGVRSHRIGWADSGLALDLDSSSWLNSSFL